MAAIGADQAVRFRGGALPLPSSHPEEAEVKAVIGRYVRDPDLEEVEKVKRVFAAVEAHLESPIPDEVKRLDPRTKEFWGRLALHFQDLSLERAWPVIEKAMGIRLEGQPSANQIRNVLNLPDAFNRIQGVARLDLRHLKLLVVPYELTLFTQLKVLELAHNRIKFIDRRVFQGLRQLEGVSLQYNLLEELPADMLANCRELKHFYAFNNKIGSLPEFFFQYNEKLEKVLLSDNQLETVSPGVFPPKHQLQHVDLSRNQLKTSPQIKGYEFKADELCGNPLGIVAEVKIEVLDMFSRLKAAAADILFEK